MEEKFSIKMNKDEIDAVTIFATFIIGSIVADGKIKIVDYV